MVVDTFAASEIHGSIVVQFFAGIILALVTPISSSYWYRSFPVGVAMKGFLSAPLQQNTPPCLNCSPMDIAVLLLCGFKAEA